MSKWERVWREESKRDKGVAAKGSSPVALCSSVWAMRVERGSDPPLPCVL
jgi:hypothetical protein